MKNTRKSAKPVSAGAIAGLAERGRDVSHFFKGQGRMVQPTQRVNMDVTVGMLEELDKVSASISASGTGVSRIKGTFSGVRCATS